MNFIISAVVFLVCLSVQAKHYSQTKSLCKSFGHLFDRKRDYATIKTHDEQASMLGNVSVRSGSALDKLIGEINRYIVKTKGTTDFSIIQNKVERTINMYYEQVMANASTPTHIGLMGTFAGVFIGVCFFLGGIDSQNGISDDSISGLLLGVLVSMSTSLIGLIMTTDNNNRINKAKKKVEEEKNIFYDFIQTELMPSLDVNLVAAISQLHKTVNRFQPAFDGVINRFQETFDRCTLAFGHQFEQNVTTVAGAVRVMGENMNKINANIDLQKQLIATLRSGDIVRGMDKYVEAADHFADITQSLDKFEEARRMMLAATQEAINMQKEFNNSLEIPRHIAVELNKIFERLKNFEQSINEAADNLRSRDILGKDLVDRINSQINGIAQKGKLADRYLGIADDNLENLFNKQCKAIDAMNQRYADAISRHIEGFEAMLSAHSDELRTRHDEFRKTLEHSLTAEEVKKDFSNLHRLTEIAEQLKTLAASPVKANDLRLQLQAINDELEKIKMHTAENRGSMFSGLFGGNSKK